MARSGRARSSRESRSSGQLRSWSARVRAGVVRPELDIPPTLLAGPAPRPRISTRGEEGRRLTLSCTTGRPRTSAWSARSTRTPSSPRRPSSWSPTAWAATTAATSPARSWSRSSRGSPTTATTRAAAPRSSPTPSRACQRRIAEYGDAHRAQRRARWYAGTTAVVGAAGRGRRRSPSGCWPTSATPGSTAFAERRARAGQRRPLRRPGADRRRRDHRRRRATHPERHVITRALGGPEGVRGRLLPAAAASVERLLLCSDGVSGMIDDDEIAAILESRDDPRDAADRVVAAAVAAGGRDNATAVVVDVVGLVAETRPTTPRARGESRREAGGPAVTEHMSAARSYRAGGWFGIFGDARHRAAAAVGEGPGGRALGAGRRRRRASTRCSTP